MTLMIMMAIMMITIITIATIIITTIINNHSSNNRAQTLRKRCANAAQMLQSADGRTFPAEISNALTHSVTFKSMSRIGIGLLSRFRRCLAPLLQGSTLQIIATHSITISASRISRVRYRYARPYDLLINEAATVINFAFKFRVSFVTRAN